MKAKVELQHVTKDMLIGDVVKNYPDSIGVMLEQGMHCIGCHVATWETLEQGCQGHGINADELVDKINKIILKQGK